MTNEDFKELSLNTLNKTCNEIISAYSKIYDEKSRDELFLKEIVDMLLFIVAPVDVYARDGQVHPGYVLEKLEYLKNRTETQIRYWNARLEEEKKKDEEKK